MSKGANLAIHTMLLQWESAYRRSAEDPDQMFMPETLYHQIDGGSENVNKTTLAVCELMVAMRMVKKIVLTRLPPGHTHEDIDARFGVLWRTMYHSQINSPIGNILFYSYLCTLFYAKPFLCFSIAYKKAITEAFRKSREQDLDVRIVELFAIPDYTTYFNSDGCIDPSFERFSKMSNAQLQFIFEICEQSEAFPLGVKTSYRAYASDEVIELLNKDSIPWKGGTEPADIVGLVPIRLHVKTFPENGMSILKSLPMGVPVVAPFAPNHMDNIDKVLKFVATKFTYSHSQQYLDDWNHWANSRYPVKMDAEAYVDKFPLHVPFNDIIFGRRNGAGISCSSTSRPLEVSMFDVNTLLCAESQPSVLHRYQRKSVPSRILIADDRLESCAVITLKRPRQSMDNCVSVNTAPQKKKKEMKYHVGQRVDFKKPKERTWIAGIVTMIDEETCCYTVVDGKNATVNGLVDGDRLREAELYQVNDTVYAKYKSYKDVFPGTISAVNSDFTYNVLFTDGDIAVNVTIDKIEPRDIIDV